MLAKYDALNPAALKRLIGSGVKLQPFSNDIMAACYKATKEVYDEIADQERQVQEDLRAVEGVPRRRRSRGSSVAENRFDNFMIAAERMSQRGPRSSARSTRHRKGPAAAARQVRSTIAGATASRCCSPSAASRRDRRRFGAALPRDRPATSRVGASVPSGARAGRTAVRRPAVLLGIERSSAPSARRPAAWRAAAFAPGRRSSAALPAR